MNMGRIILAWAWIGLCACPALAGEASGRFSVEGDKPGVIAPSHAAAFVTRDPFDPRRRTVEIVLSAAPVDVEAALSSLQPHTQVINQPALRENDYILLWLRPDGRMDANATFHEGMTQYLAQSGTNLRFMHSERTPTRIAGRLVSSEPEKTLSGDRYAFDLAFDTAIAQPARGKPLRKGGGAPGAALLAMLAAVRAGHWPVIKAACGPEALKMIEADYRSPRENAQMARDLMAVWLPRSGLRVTGGELRGETADLEIEGDMAPGIPALYLARMRKIGAAWLFDGAGLAGLLPK
jgi:hypothetical protein